MGQRPKVALCGAGVIASAHASVAAALSMPVIAVASRTGVSARRVAEEVNAEVVSVDSLPAGADLVVIETPPQHHRAHAVACMEAGAAVIVERPLCATLADADELVAAARRHGNRLLYAENLSYAPAVLRFLHHLRGLGPLRHLEVRTINPAPTWGEYRTEGWGGGALFDLGSHAIALALMANAPAMPTTVSAEIEAPAGPTTDTVSDEYAVDDHAVVHLTYADGFRIRVVASYRCGDTPQWDLQAASDMGVVRAELLPVPSLEVNGESVPLPRPTMRIPALDQYGYRAEWEAFLGALAAGSAPPTDASFGRRVLEVICAAYASARTGTPEELPFAGPRDLTPHELWRRH